MTSSQLNSHQKGNYPTNQRHSKRPYQSNKEINTDYLVETERFHKSTATIFQVKQSKMASTRSQRPNVARYLVEKTE
jgi:hypothetical protein